MQEPQVDKAHYTFERYGFEERFVSYYWQLKEVLDLHPTSLLEVGVGDKVFGNFIKDNTPVMYTSVDVAADLSPDVLGSVTALPFTDSSYDVACAFEVLEHLPFSEFETAVSELARVAKDYMVISVPHFGPTLSFSCKIPFLPHIRASLKIPFPKEHHFNGQHHWEIGKRGYPVRRIRTILEKHGDIMRDFVPFAAPYHHFFVIQRNKDRV